VQGYFVAIDEQVQGFYLHIQRAVSIRTTELMSPLQTLPPKTNKLDSKNIPIPTDASETDLIAKKTLVFLWS
jgi:hypothetical protein